MSLRWTLIVCCLFGLLGCAGRGETDLLHARLREQQQQLVDVQAQLDVAQKEVKEAHREAEVLRTHLAQMSTPGLLPEQSDLLVRVADLQINSMLTAGLDRDEHAGDDALAIQFSPVDADGELVRLPGEITITVLDPQLPEAHREIARWTFTAAESRDHWVRGFLGTGYQFTLPWPSPPTNSELVAHVLLQAVDGREFSATHVLSITPPVITADARVDARRPVTPPTEARGIVRESTNWTESTMPVYR